MISIVSITIKKTQLAQYLIYNNNNTHGSCTEFNRTCYNQWLSTTKIFIPSFLAELVWTYPLFL